jgi:hypothetical protein
MLWSEPTLTTELNAPDTLISHILIRTLLKVLVKDLEQSIVFLESEKM